MLPAPHRTVRAVLPHTALQAKEYYDSLDFTEEFFVEEYQKLVTHAMQYAAVRADWACLEREERVEADRARTNTHNQFLNDVQRYASFQKRSGENCHWFEALGQGIEPENISVKRARIGDWACYIALFTSLNMR